MNEELIKRAVLLLQREFEMCIRDRCIPLLDDSSCDDDARVRYQAANRIVLILWDYIKEMIEQVKKDQANGAGSTAKLIQNLTDALADQSAKASLPDRKGKAVPLSLIHI